MSLIIYADFDCPSCYLASCRVDALSAVGIEVDWRAVDHHPDLIVVGHRLVAAEQDELIEEFAEPVARLLPGEGLPWAMSPRTAPVAVWDVPDRGRRHR